MSTYEISARLAIEGTPLNRTSVGEILAEEGFGRLLRHPEPTASTSPATHGRDTRLPRTARLDFASWPATIETGKAGLLLLIPDLVELGLPDLVKRAGYPGTRVVPAASWLLSLLALKLTRTRRVSHVDDLLLADPAASLFAGLATLPKKSALTDYSYRTGHDHQRRFLAALDAKMVHAGLATAADAIFDLDFHAVMHRGHDPALEKHYVPTRSQRARSAPTFFAQVTGTHNLFMRETPMTAKRGQAREVIMLCVTSRKPLSEHLACRSLDHDHAPTPARRGSHTPVTSLPSPGDALAGSAEHLNCLTENDLTTVTLNCWEIQLSEVIKATPNRLTHVPAPWC